MVSWFCNFPLLVFSILIFNRPFCRYGSHFDFYCFERHYGMLRGQINVYLPPGHPIYYSLYVGFFHYLVQRKQDKIKLNLN